MAAEIKTRYTEEEVEWLKAAWFKGDHIDNMVFGLLENFGRQRTSGALYAWVVRQGWPRRQQHRKEANGEAYKRKFEWEVASAAEQKDYSRVNEVLSKNNATAKYRNCLRCSKSFPSEHVGKRICAECKSNAEYIDLLGSGLDF